MFSTNSPVLELVAFVELLKTELTRDAKINNQVASQCLHQHREVRPHRVVFWLRPSSTFQRSS